MKDPNCVIFVFESTHQALAAEQALKEAGIRHAVINTPREFSADCGISLRLEPGRRERVQRLLEERSISYKRIEDYYSPWISCGE
jgi:hypothetical protein